MGASADNIIFKVNELITDKAKCEAMAQAKNPNGDGKVAKRIADVVSQFFAAKLK